MKFDRHYLCSLGIEPKSVNKADCMPIISKLLECFELEKKELEVLISNILSLKTPRLRSVALRNLSTVSYSFAESSDCMLETQECLMDAAEMVRTELHMTYWKDLFNKIRLAKNVSESTFNYVVSGRTEVFADGQCFPFCMEEVAHFFETLKQV